MKAAMNVKITCMLLYMYQCCHHHGQKQKVEVAALKSESMMLAINEDRRISSVFGMEKLVSSPEIASAMTYYEVTWFILMHVYVVYILEDLPSSLSCN